MVKIIKLVSLVLRNFLLQTVLIIGFAPLLFAFLYVTDVYALDQVMKIFVIGIYFFRYLSLDVPTTFSMDKNDIAIALTTILSVFGLLIFILEKLSKKDIKIPVRFTYWYFLLVSLSGGLLFFLTESLISGVLFFCMYLFISYFFASLYFILHSLKETRSLDEVDITKVH